MSQEFKMSQKLKKWREWMATIHDEIRALVWDAKIYGEVQDIIREQHSNVHWCSIYSRYLGRIHLPYALSQLRRQIKPPQDSISLIGLLDEIAKNPEELSFNDYCSVLAESDPEKLDVSKADFKQYADASGTHVCPRMVKRDLAKLKKATKTCEDLANEYISDRAYRDPEQDATFDQLAHCIQLLDKTYVKYHLLFYGEGLTTLTAPRAGSAKGLIRMTEDFDDELEDFKEYM